MSVKNVFSQSKRKTWNHKLGSLGIRGELAVSWTSARVFSTTYRMTVQVFQPFLRKILKSHKLCIQALFGGPLIVVLCVSGYSAKIVQDRVTRGSDRSYTIYEASHSPKIIKIKGIKNIDSPHFPHDMEIEVENVYHKPIYFMNIDMVFPRVKHEAHTVGVGVGYLWGRRKLVNFKERPTEEDPFIKPGETVFLKPEEHAFKWLLQYLPKIGSSLAELDEILLFVGNINVGDGTDAKLETARAKKQLGFMKKTLGCSWGEQTDDGFCYSGTPHICPNWVTHPGSTREIITREDTCGEWVCYRDIAILCAN